MKKQTQQQLFLGDGIEIADELKGTSQWYTIEAMNKLYEQIGLVK